MKVSAASFSTVLAIDTTQKDLTQLALIEGQQVTPLAKSVRAQELQAMISELLNSRGLPVTDLAAIAVLVGPGSFTGIRIGATAANTLHWLYKIPLLAIPSDDFDQSIAQLLNGQEFTTTSAIIPRV